MCDFQPLPIEALFPQRLDASLDALRLLASADASPVYSYVVRTTMAVGNAIVQRGCGPNLEGGWISLCTCKHRMRAFRKRDEWPGVWVAGLASARASGSAHGALFYLMRVGWAHSSFCELWESTTMPAATKLLKAATSNPLGDLYVPSDPAGDPWAPGTYEPPCRSHRHWPEQYQRDITRRSPLLVGEPGRSYVWTAPGIWSQKRNARGERKYPSLRAFIETLAEAPPA